jgi:hypothetical protein
MIHPNAVTDDFVWEPVAAVAIRIRFHPRNLAFIREIWLAPAQVDNTL